MIYVRTDPALSTVSQCLTTCHYVSVCPFGQPCILLLRLFLFAHQCNDFCVSFTVMGTHCKSCKRVLNKRLFKNTKPQIC